MNSVEYANDKFELTVPHCGHYQFALFMNHDALHRTTMLRTIKRRVEHR